MYHASLRHQNQVLSEGSLIKAGTKKTFKKSESEYLGAVYDARFQRFHSLRSDEPRPLAHCHWSWITLVHNRLMLKYLAGTIPAVPLVAWGCELLSSLLLLISSN